MRVFLYSGYDFYKKQCKYYKNNRPDDPASVFHNHACPCIMSCNRKYRCCNSKHDHDLSAEQKYHKSRYIGRKVGNLHGTGRFCHTHFSKSCIQKQEKGSCPGAIKTIIAAHSKRTQGTDQNLFLSGTPVYPDGASGINNGSTCSTCCQ